MPNIGIIADLSDVDTSFIYELDSIGDDDTPLIGDVFNEEYTQDLSATTEEIDAFFKQFNL